jgi:protein-tyrosine-phosphatase
MAEAIARQDAADVIEPSSAGIYPLGHLPEPTVGTLTANNYSAESLYSKGISREAVRDADVIVNLSGITIDRLFSAGSSRLHSGQQIENWEVTDPYGEGTATYQRIFEELKTRVLQLADQLRVQNRAAHV